jgi:hypothetical protein
LFARKESSDYDYPEDAGMETSLDKIEQQENK